MKILELKEEENKRKINILDLKELISSYYNQFNIPKNSDEFIDFKKVFELSWKNKKDTILFEDILTFKKTDFDVLNIFFDFIETQYEISNKYPVLFILKFNSHLTNNELNDGDKVFLKCKITSVETNRFEIYYDVIKPSIIQPIIEINFQINSLEIVEKFDQEIEIKKLEYQNKKTPEINSKNNQITISSSGIQSFNVKENTQLNSLKMSEFLDILTKLDELKSKSRQTKSNLNQFQNEVYNKKHLDEFNSKKEVVNNLIDLEFKTVCEVLLISKENLEFRINYKNKNFYFYSRKYNDELQKTTFFLKNNTPVEIKFRIIKVRDTYNSVDIELVSIKKSNEVRMFGKFIQLEHYWSGIYIFLVFITLIVFSKLNFNGFFPFFLKLTLWVFVGYIVNKIGVKYIYKN